MEKDQTAQVQQPVKAIIPEHLYKSRRWRAVFHLFMNHEKLKRFFTTAYFDFKNEKIHVNKLRAASKQWSETEQYMLALAFHCFNERYKFDLGWLDYLDYNNRRLFLKAIEIRYERS